MRGSTRLAGLGPPRRSLCSDTDVNSRMNCDSGRCFPPRRISAVAGVCHHRALRIANSVFMFERTGKSVLLNRFHELLRSRPRQQ